MLVRVRVRSRLEESRPTVSGRTESMSSVRLDLEDELIAVLKQFSQPIERSARDLIILELYREGKIFPSRAAELLGLPPESLASFAPVSGPPSVSMTKEEWRAERRHTAAL